jgi:hypothetical protein
MTTIMQEILTGNRPFEHLTKDAIVVHAITQGKLPLPPESLDARPALDRELWNMCNRCWITPASLRPSMIDIVVNIIKDRQSDPALSIHTYELRPYNRPQQIP